MTLLDEDLISDWLTKDNPALLKQFIKLGIRAALHKMAGFEITSTAIASPQYKIPQTYAEALLEAGRLAMENEKLSAKIEQDAPLVEYAEAVQMSEDAVTFLAFAKMINTGRTRLFRAMREMEIIIKKNGSETSPFRATLPLST